MHDFAGRVALVTGGGGGIGRATALAFARAGAKVVIGNRNAERGTETVELIERAGGTALFCRTDVTVETEVAELVAAAVRTYGALDFAFNNAGTFTTLSTIVEQSVADFDELLAVNVKGTWLSLKYELKQMQKQGRGAIVNNASVVGVNGSGSGAAGYSASKHAVLGLTKCAALENARKGIRVNAISPAVVETDMAAAFAADLKIALPDMGKANPIGRIGRPDEIAAAVLYLCSDDSPFLLGHNLIVDGGYTAQ